MGFEKVLDRRGRLRGVVGDERGMDAVVGVEPVEACKRRRIGADGVVAQMADAQVRLQL